MRNRIFLSPPHMSGDEQAFVRDAFDTNWIAPLGPNVECFEQEFAALHEDNGLVPQTLALTSGTAALHLALIEASVQPGDTVIVSTFTFSASVNPIIYLGAEPFFVDSDSDSWNMSPELLEEAFKSCATQGKRVRAVIVVHLYGQCADMDPIVEICRHNNVVLIEDAAEALGAKYKGRLSGTFGRLAISSFNGNKIITTSGGGMLMANEVPALADVRSAVEVIAHARKLSTQAREPAPHYQHTEIGFNYRMSNVLAGIGRGQLKVLHERIAARRRNFDNYYERLSNLPGVSFMPEPSWSRGNRWLTCVLFHHQKFGATREDVRLHLEANNIESRPIWKPMHLQPVFEKYPCIESRTSEALFNAGLCLPSGSELLIEDLDRVCNLICDMHS